MADIESPFDKTFPSFSSVDHSSFEGVICLAVAFEWIERNDP